VAYFLHPNPARSTKEDDMPDEASTRVRSMVEKLLEADMADQISQRSREIAEAVSEATDNVTHRAEEAWKDSAPQRREAEKAARHAARDAIRWGRRTWEKDLRPEIRRLWKQRKAAIAAAGAAIPAGRELVEDAAARAGIRERRERRHWTAFFLGILIGAAAGAVIAILTTPKPGRQMRDELSERARHAADQAREAAGGAEWMPLFQREETTNGGNTGGSGSTGSTSVSPPPTAGSSRSTPRRSKAQTTPSEPAEAADTAGSPSVDAGPAEGEEQA
jgi:gas vesicle protein